MTIDFPVLISFMSITLIIHELGHLIMHYIFTGKLSQITITIYGAATHTKGECTILQRIAVCSAGYIATFPIIIYIKDANLAMFLFLMASVDMIMIFLLFYLAIKKGINYPYKKAAFEVDREINANRAQRRINKL